MNKYVIAGPLAAMAIIFGCVTFFSSQKTINFLQHGVKGKGTVVRMEISSRNTSYPVVRFTAPSGETFEDRGGVASNPPAFKQGQEVEVLYLADKPKEWVINDWLELYFLASIFGFFTIALSIAAVCVLIFMGRPQRRAVIFDSERKSGRR